MVVSMTAGNADPGRGAERGERQRIDRIRAERLLDDTDTDPDTDRGTESLRRLLAAARGPVHPDEVRREAEAVEAFRAAGVMAPPRRHVTAARRRLWPQVIGVKAAGLALAVALTGVALAAGIGVLPNPLDAPPVPTSAAPSTPPGSPLSSNADWRSPSSSRSSPPSPSAGAGSAGASASPGAAADRASLVGLCRAYQARGDRDPGAAMGGAAFAGLVAAAGGPDQVAAFCADLLAAENPPGNGNGNNGNNGSGNGNGTASPTND
jgi:hypothetical protein